MIGIRQIKVKVNKDSEKTLLAKIAKKLHVEVSSINSYEVLKKSIDARDKSDIYYVYEVAVNIENESAYLKKGNKDIYKYQKEVYKAPEKGSEHLDIRPVIVGSGPAGLFCAYILATEDYRPIIIERGKKIEDRVKDVEKFWTDGTLNLNSNVQFGEGGAGTFSDGKLNTLIKDERKLGRKVLETFVECGAPEEILYLNKPHIGTDTLREVIVKLREKIKALGGTFVYNSCFTNLFAEAGKLTKIEVNNKDIVPVKVLVLALGHSARDTFEMLQYKVQMEAKPIAIGVRIQHPQSLINIAQYGEVFASQLPNADYKLTYKTENDRGVYSFCMCPGGYVVNASSEESALVINGMSNQARDSQNANSAIVVSLNVNDYPEGILGGMKFQRNLEKKAYEFGEGKIPTQRLQDFMNNEKTTKLGDVAPEFKGKFTLCDLNMILPKYICDALKEAINYFDSKINGFWHDDALISAVETRTSSPIRIIRDKNHESSIKGVYPCGEGAGYAGGIMSSAIDGIKTAEKIMEKYS